MGSVARRGEEMNTTSNPPPHGYGGQAVERPTPTTQLLESTPSFLRRFLWRILAIIIGGLFVYAGALKAWDPVRFASDIQNYHVLPWALNVRLAFYLPWLEMICGFALIFRRLYSGALALLLALLLVFIGASIAAKARGIDISCGCFGHVSDQLSFAWHMVLDFAIVAGVVALWRWDGGNPRAAERASR
jgi:putative oxidoreductase